jgi:hypothetical protein
MPCDGRAFFGQCHAITSPDCRRFYVRFTQTDGPAPSAALPQWDQVCVPDFDWTVLLVIPHAWTGPGDPWDDAERTLPLDSHWTEANACRWQSDPAEVLSALCTHIGLAPADQRIFISYARSETSPLADQLFSELTKRGFDVFLDRCSVPVGVKFQERLMQDLDDKAVVVLLHSESVAKRSSHWVEKELTRVTQYRHGLIALQFPDSSGQMIPIRRDCYPDTHVTIQPTDLNPDGSLSCPSLYNVLARISETHTLALFRRRTALLNNLVTELNSAGKNFRILPNKDIACGQPEFVFAISPRPPELNDYHGLHSRNNFASGATTGVCLTPTPSVLLNRQTTLRWLSQIALINHVDQESLRSFINSSIQ